MEQREIDNMLLSMIQKHFPSLPLSDEYTDWGKWLGFARAAYEAGRASPASAPEGWKWRRHARTRWEAVGHWDSIEEMAYNDMLGRGWDVEKLYSHAAPTPPVSEDRKDAERFREGWTHACNALCMEIALWIERCPHCGMPAPKAPAMQEGKP